MRRISMKLKCFVQAAFSPKYRRQSLLKMKGKSRRSQNEYSRENIKRFYQTNLLPESSSDFL